MPSSSPLLTHTEKYLPTKKSAIIECTTISRHSKSYSLPWPLHKILKKIRQHTQELEISNWSPPARFIHNFKHINQMKWMLAKIGRQLKWKKKKKEGKRIYTCGAEFSKVMFSAMKSSPSTITDPHPKVPVPITRAAWWWSIWVAVLFHDSTVASGLIPANVMKFFVLGT